MIKQTSSSLNACHSQSAQGRAAPSGSFLPLLVDLDYHRRGIRLAFAFSSPRYVAADASTPVYHPTIHLAFSFSSTRHLAFDVSTSIYHPTILLALAFSSTRHLAVDVSAVQDPAIPLAGMRVNRSRRSGVFVTPAKTGQGYLRGCWGRRRIQAFTHMEVVFEAAQP